MEKKEERIKLRNGDEFMGIVNEAKEYQGQGTYKYKNGQEYTGEFKDSMMEGRGKLLDKHGNTISGQWKANRLQGQCVIKYANGDTYIGMAQDNQRHGSGELKRVGYTYKGQFRHDSFNGEGRLVWKTGSYEGSFMDSLFEGNGELNDQGSIYIGGFMNGRKEGKGRMCFKNKECYQGQFVNDQMSGYGVYTYVDMSSYEGSWQFNQKNGIGKLVFVSGEIECYEGTFQHDRMAGEGCMLFRDNTKYEGQFNNNAVHGTGELSTSHWNIQAVFEDNQKHGDLKMTKQARECKGLFCYDQEKIQYTDFGKRFQRNYYLYYLNYICMLGRLGRRVLAFKRVQQFSAKNVMKTEQKLCRMLEKEIKVNEEGLEDTGDLIQMAQLKGFNLIDIQGSLYVEMVKQIGSPSPSQKEEEEEEEGETEVVVQFRSRSIQEKEEEEEEEGQQDRNSLNSKMEENGVDYEDMCYFTVFLKKGEESVAYECMGVDSELVVNHVVNLGGDMTNYQQQTRLERDNYQYLGPDFHSLDIHLQASLRQYLFSHGIDSQVIQLIMEYSMLKDAKLYLHWAKSMHAFLQ